MTPLSRLLLLIGAATTAVAAAAAPYHRAFFGDWSDDNHDGCNRRCELLAERSLIPPTYSTPKHTIVRAGYWADAYDFTTPIRDASDIDLDHVVALKLAWTWGADGWDAAQLNQFYNDNENLASTSSHTNRSKGDKPPSKWTPQGEVERCFYLWRFEHIVQKYGLTVPTKEQAVLDSCQNRGDAGQ